MISLSVAEARELAVKVLIRAGAAERDAEITADDIVYAEASGVSSHGLLRIPYLADQITSGKIRRIDPVQKWTGTAAVSIDAGFGFGYVAADHAVKAVLDGLKESPVVLAAISRSHHFGMAGRHAERLAEAGYLGLAFSGTSGAIAPVGGRKALLGNSPMALAVPLPGDGPLVVDLAPAVVARGRIAGAARQEESIPDNWALDEEGVPTTDPNAALKGTMRAIGGYKGVALALLVDLLIASTTESLLPGEAPSVYVAQGSPPELGHLIIGIDPPAFGMTEMETKAARYLQMLLDDGNGMSVPGARKRTARRNAETSGIQVPRSLVEELRQRASG